MTSPNSRLYFARLEVYPSNVREGATIGDLLAACRAQIDTAEYDWEKIATSATGDVSLELTELQIHGMSSDDLNSALAEYGLRPADLSLSLGALANHPGLLERCPPLLCFGTRIVTPKGLGIPWVVADGGCLSIRLAFGEVDGWTGHYMFFAIRSLNAPQLH